MKATLNISGSYENISRIAVGQDAAYLHKTPIVDLCQTCKLSRTIKGVRTILYILLLSLL